MDKTEAWENYRLLMYKIAQRIHKRYPHLLEVDEKISLACEGLMRAAERFDSSKGFAFSTYAGKLMEYAVLDGVYTEMRVATPSAKKNHRVKYGFVASVDWTMDTSSEDWGHGGGSDNFDLFCEAHERMEDGNPFNTTHLAREVEKIRATLTPAQDKVFVMRYIEGKRFHEIAAELGLSDRRVAHMRLRTMRRNYPALREEHKRNRK